MSSHTREFARQTYLPTADRKAYEKRMGIEPEKTKGQPFLQKASALKAELSLNNYLNDLESIL